MVKRRRLSDSSPSLPASLPSSRNQEPERERVSKRRFFGKSHLLNLPQELILRILHFLPVHTLLTVSRTSRKLHALASDPQLWKSKFWTKFIHPRIQRRARLSLPNTIEQSGSKVVLFANDWKLWLDDHILIQEERDLVAQHPGTRKQSDRVTRHSSISSTVAPSKGPALDWKAKFRLRSNWQRGSARSSQLNVLTSPEKTESNTISSDVHREGPPLLGRFYEGYFFSADSKHGIRVFDCGKARGTKSDWEILQRPCSLGNPVCMAIEESLLNDTSGKYYKSRGIDFVIGYHNGSYAIYHFDPKSRQLCEKYIKRCFDDKEAIVLVALSFPYLVLITDLNQLSILSFHNSMVISSQTVSGQRLDLPPPKQPLFRPKLVTELGVDRAWFPTCMSFRKDSVSSNLIASIVFSIRSITIGSSITVQELHLSSEVAHLVSTNVASPPMYDAFDQVFFGRTANMAFTAPTCVSYRHPYILTSHADNTLVLYYLFSDADGKLGIRSGHQLWGHNTSVMAVEVGLRKAVSVDRRGEVRVWDLQGRYEKLSGRDRSVRVGGSGDPLFLNLDGKQGVQTERCLVGFGEEGIVVMDKVKDLDHSKTDFRLVVYDFT
ncbi:hypothetical protein ABW19_dt0202852 [Dactylella cylindrospora]|nr:hypothetical protein ABW19_dt0202852 [Dactylella cylindrospora]